MKNTKQNIIVIGPRGYRKEYGGWETFIKNLVDNWNEDSTQFHIYEVTQEKNKNAIIKHNNGVLCPQIYMHKIGSAMMMLFCVKALFSAMQYIKENSLNNVILYILGVRIGPLFGFLRHRLKKMNIKVIINPDGLEWTRARWSRPVKWYLQISEAMMFRNSDYIVCDSKTILNYIKKKYKKLKAPAKYISYGANIKESSSVINSIAKDFFRQI